MIEYKVFTEYNFEFWGYAGWFFASRQVEKELGAKNHADDNMIWIVALERGRSVGISGIKFHKNCAELKHSYVLPEFRGNGIYTTFTNMRVDLANNHGCDKIKVTCTDMSKKIIEKLGFRETGRRGRYTTFEYEIKSDSVK